MAEKKEEKKKSGLISFFFIFIVLVVGIVLWSRYISTSGLNIKEYALIDNNLPETFHGLKIIHFSDIHFGRTTNFKELEKVVETINDYNPDIVVFTGDLIDKSIKPNTKTKERIADILKKIDSNLGNYAVSGNHDYVKTDFLDIMELSEFKLLNNTSQLLFYKGDIPIEIVGLPSSIQDHYDLEATFPEQEEEHYRIVLAHEPDNIDVLTEYNINLMLSGHSHGGQIRLPFFGATVLPLGSKKYYDEYYKVDETNLYISSGIGTTRFSFRFLNKPSINLYRLYNQ